MKVPKAVRRWGSELLPPIVSRHLKRRRQPSTRRGLNGLDSLIEGFLDLSAPGYFVELGAHDGLLSSNTYFLEAEFGWRGVLIEPSLNRFLECLKNRSDENYFANVACVPFGYSDEFVRMTYADSMSITRSVPLDLPDANNHVAAGLQFMPDPRQSVDFGAVAETMSSVLERAKSPKQIDLLSLDVEGAELSVLEGIDHERFRFSVAVIETRAIDRIELHMRAAQYEFVEKLSHHDYLFRDSRQS